MDSISIPNSLIIAAIMVVCSALSFSWIATIVAMLRYERSPMRGILGILIPIYAFFWCMAHARKTGLVLFRWLWIIGIVLGVPLTWFLWTTMQLAQWA